MFKILLESGRPKVVEGYRVNVGGDLLILYKGTVARPEGGFGYGWVICDQLDTWSTSRQYAVEVFIAEYRKKKDEEVERLKASLEL